MPEVLMLSLSCFALLYALFMTQIWPRRKERFVQRWVVAATIITLLACATVIYAAIVKGTNCGFVTVAPTADPAGSGTVTDAIQKAQKDVAPAGATAITEVGWYCDNATEESNFEVGIYDHNSVTNKPKTQLAVEATNAKGTTAGWKTATLDPPCTVTPGATYWIVFQLDDTATATNTNNASAAGDRVSSVGGTSLPTTWQSGSTEYADYVYSIYAVYETGGTTNTVYYRRRM